VRQSIKDFAVIVAESFDVKEPIFEFGSLQVAGQEGFADLRPLFPGKEYVGADMREGLGVDRLLDLHHIDLPSETAGAVLCFDTLEHVEYPLRALEEIHRILKDEGIVVISSVMDHPIHDYPHDYWRFTPEAFRSLLKPFSESFVGYAGEETFPHTVVGIGFKGTVPKLDDFRRRFQQWQDSQAPKQPNIFKQITKLLTPPILHPLLRGGYRMFSSMTKRNP
jgi:SAM-dependent methyltransferase